MSNNVTAGVIVGIIATLLVYPLMVLVGAASVPFHRGSDSTTATAGVLFVARWSFYLTCLFGAVIGWLAALLVFPKTTASATIVTILLALGYAYFR